MENFESPKQPEEIAFERAQQIISELGLDLNVTIENREVRLDGQDNWENKQVFHFSMNNDPGIDWTMNINTDPGYLESDLPEAIEKGYKEKKGVE